MSEPLRNALIESFVIHLRNLVDFFYPAQIQGDDVIAAEFLDDLNEWEKLSSISLMLAAARVRAHKEVSHLTRKRFSGTPPEKSWAVAELMDEIRKVLNQFTQAASPTKLDESVRRFGEAWK
jgi:truncated hemoglobin YjbI